MDHAPRLRRIRASAGSGKTYTLTSHFLQLLAAADPSDDALDGRAACALRPVAGQAQAHAWPEILAITFTNRAAAEMKERVINRLKNMALGLEKDMPAPWTSQLAAAWLRRILRRYGALNIRTIDSLLHLLVRLAALELGLPPNFEPIFATDEALGPLLDTVLEHSRTDPALHAELERACRDMLAHTKHRGFMAGTTLRAAVLDLVLMVSGPAGEQLDTSEAISAHLTMLCSLLRSAAGHMRDVLDAEGLPAHANLFKALDACLDENGGNDAELPPRSVMLRKEDGLEACLNKAGKGKASDEALAAYQRLRDATMALDTRADLLRGALRIMPFVHLARCVAQTLPDFLQQQSAMPAVLIPILARQVLEGGFGVSEAFCRMGSSLTHLLMDEFQDTSREQWAALHPLVAEALSRGGSLTWVGDVKQAIYSWRGGDAQLFDEVMHDNELLAIAETVDTDTLPTNWRSRAAIIRANNSIFDRLAQPAMARTVLARMLPPNTPPNVLDDAAARVVKGFSGAAQLESGKSGGSVHLQYLAAPTADELEENVLCRLSALIHSLHPHHPLGHVCVLVRSNTKAARVAEHLLAEGMPVVTENSLLLASHPLIRQCVAMLQWLHAPADDTAFWSVLTGPGLLLPLADLSRSVLEDWLVQRRRTGPLYAAFRNDFPAQWQRWLGPFHQRAGLMTPYDTIREVLRRWQVEERLPDEAPFTQRLLEILYAAEQRGQTSLAAFLEHWNAHGQGEKAPMPEHVDAVRVMTIHKSKGLQFPVVIVPWHDFSARPDAPTVEAEVDGLHVLTPRKAGLGDPYYTALAHTARETLNLLYVAWTRAEDALYGFLTSTTSRALPGLGQALPCLLEDLPAPWRQDNTGLHLGTPPVPPMPQAEATPPAEADAHDVLAAPSPAPSPTLPLPGSPSVQSWQPMDWLPRLKIYRSAPDTLIFSGKRRGSFVHHCLECLRLPVRAWAEAAPHEPLPLDRIAEQSVAEARRTFALPVPETELPDIVAGLRWFVHLPEVPRWLREGLPEQPMLDADGSEHRPDLMVPHEQGSAPGWTVVEYKTGQPAPKHAQQLGCYLELLQRASGHPAQGVLIYMDQQTTQEVPSPMGVPSFTQGQA